MRLDPNRPHRWGSPVRPPDGRAKREPNQAMNRINPFPRDDYDK